MLAWQGRIRRFGTTVRLNDAIPSVYVGDCCYMAKKGNGTAPNSGRGGRRTEPKRRRRWFDLLPTFLSTSVLHIASLSCTITHLSLVPQWPQKLQRPRWCVVLATLSTPSCILTANNDSGLHPHLFNPRSRKGYPLLLLSHLPSRSLINPPLARDRRRPTSVPQAPLRSPAHHRPAKRPADDRRLSALPLRSEE